MPKLGFRRTTKKTICVSYLMRLFDFIKIVYYPFGFSFGFFLKFFLLRSCARSFFLYIILILFFMFPTHTHTLSITNTCTSEWSSPSTHCAGWANSFFRFFEIVTKECKRKIQEIITLIYFLLWNCISENEKLLKEHTCIYSFCCSLFIW